MKINGLFETKKRVFSLEIFPPKKTSGIERIFQTLDDLVVLRPDFISVTYGAGASDVGNLTCDISRRIKELGVEPLAHLTCVSSEKRAVLETIGQLKGGNIENILALRGDLNPKVSGYRDFSFASDLVGMIRKNGDFNVVGACYPEGHFENRGLDEDIANLRYKIDAGVSHLITQLFFDNGLFFHFMERARARGVDVPIQAGIMPIVATRQIERTVALSGASLPPAFTKMVSRYCNDETALFEAGIDYATRQIIELFEWGVDGVHLYTMNNPVVARKIHENIVSYLR